MNKLWNIIGILFKTCLLILCLPIIIAGLLLIVFIDWVMEDEYYTAWCKTQGEKL